MIPPTYCSEHDDRSLVHTDRLLRVTMTTSRDKATRKVGLCAAVKIRFTAREEPLSWYLAFSISQLKSTDQLVYVDTHTKIRFIG